MTIKLASNNNWISCASNGENDHDVARCEEMGLPCTYIVRLNGPKQ